MNIGIIGVGNVGGTLGRRWAQLGHSIAYGVREPEGEKNWRPLRLVSAPAQLHSRTLFAP